MSDVYVAEGMVGLQHRAHFRAVLADLGVPYKEEWRFWRSHFTFDVTPAQTAEISKRMGMPL